MNLAAIVGIDLGGTRLKAGLVDADGQVTSPLVAPSQVRSGYDEVLARLAQVVRDIGSSSPSPVAGVGLAVAGLMDGTRRQVIAAPNCPALVGRTIADDLSQAVGLPVAMDNDANALAWGEGGWGAARGVRHFITITLGTGVGGAVVCEGRLLRGVDGGGTELGHIPISYAGPRCGCGARGCLEAYVGKRGLNQHLARHMPELAGKGLRELHRRAEGGDHRAAEVFAYLGRRVGVALGGLVNVLNPEMVVIGGGVAQAGDWVLEPLRAELRRRAFPRYIERLKVVRASLGDWGGVVGIAGLARDEFAA